MKRTAIAIMTVLVVTGCGGAKSHTASTAVPVSSPSATPTTASTPASTTQAARPATTSQSSPPTTPQGGATTSTATGGASPTTQTTPASTGGSSPTPKEIAEAQAALPGCQKEQPSITLAQLEQEAASSLGIQC